MVRLDPRSSHGGAGLCRAQFGNSSAPLNAYFFDHGTPAPLRSFLKDHVVKKTKELGWDTLSNGELLTAAEKAAFEIFLTTDKNIRYQQNLADRVIAIVVLGNSRWPVVRLYIDRVVAAVAAAKPGTYTEVEIPDQ
jgi:hypothetical protein